MPRWDEEGPSDGRGEATFGQGPCNSSRRLRGLPDQGRSCIGFDCCGGSPVASASRGRIVAGSMIRAAGKAPWRIGPPREAWRAVVTSWMAIGLLAGFASAAGAEMRVEPGDVLQVSVLEDPALGRETQVGVDGTVMMPRIGAVAVGGQDLSTIRERVERALRDQDILRSPTVVVEFAAYRPFYVGGAVARPGAIPFEPGLTPRHALILAGGLDPGDDREAGAIKPEELRASLRLASYQLLEVDSLVSRLNAELAQDVNPERGPPNLGLVPANDAQGLLDLDASLLQGRIAGRTAEQEHRRTVLSLIRSEIDILEQQAALQRDEQRLQQEEVETARSLVERGVMPAARLLDLQREASQLSRDLLETSAFAARAQEAQAVTEHALEVAGTEWRVAVQQELREALLDRARIEAEVEGLRDQALALDLSVAADPAGVLPVPVVVIHRAAASGSEEIQADMDTVILPGDILDVTLMRPPEG